MKDFSTFDFDSLPDQRTDDKPSDAVLEQAFQTEPVQHAKVREVSKISGVPEFAVKGKENQIETLNKLRNLDFSDTPVTSKFFSDYNNAVVGQNDIERLKSLEQRLNPQEPGKLRLGDAFMRGGHRFKESFLRKTYRSENHQINNLLLDEGDALEKSLQALKASPTEIGGTGLLGPLLKDVPREERAEFIKNITVEDYKSALVERFNRFQQLQHQSVARSKVAEEKYGKSGDYTIDRVFDDFTFKNTMGFVLETGVESIPEMLTAMTGIGLVPVAAATGGRVAEDRAENNGLPIVGGVTKRDDDIGTGIGIIVAGLEKVGIDRALLKKGGVEKLRDVAPETFKRIFIEGSTEALQEVVEDLGGSVDTVKGVTKDSLIKSAAGGFLGGAGVAGTINSVRVPMELVESARVKTAENLKLDEQVQKEQTKLDDIIETADGMQLKQLDPETLRQFVLDADGDKNTTVFVRTEKVKEYIATLSESDVSNDPALSALVYRLREAAALNTDVDIPIDDFIVDFTQSDHFENLRDSLVLNPESPLQSEIEQRKTEQQTYVEGLIAEASTEVESNIQAHEIYETVKDQLIDTGRLSERDAKVAAQVVPAWATVFAKENGITVTEAFERSGLNIQGPLTGKRAEIEAEGVELKQKTNGYYDDSNATITLTENSNASTFIHEFGHFIYDMERRSNGKQLQGVNNWFAKNAESVAKEAGVSTDQLSAYLSENTTGDETIDQKIYIATHEQFARGFETYLMEGKAPSVELRDVFRTIARWMTEIYRAIQGDLNVELDNEMRQVFDRLLATQDQIAAAQARAEFEPLFNEAAMAGKTEEEFAKYQESKNKVKDKATETLRDKLIKQLTREQESWWKEQRDDYAVEESKRLESERVHKARNVLTSGQIQLSTQDVRDILDTPKGALPAKLNKMRSPDGMEADVAAAALGYQSGAELVNDLIESPTLKEASQEAAQARMLEEHGDLMNDGTIERAADDALQNEERGKLLLDELKSLSKLSGRQSPIDRAAIKSLAKENIGKLSYRQMHPTKYRSAEVKAAKEAALAHRSGDNEAAMVAKTRQVMNYYLGMEATKAKEAVEKIVSHKARYRKKSVREDIQRGNAGHMEQIDKITGRFEFRKTATIASTEQTLSEFISTRANNHGETIYTDRFTINEANVTHWKNVTFNELQGVDDTVRSLEHAAKKAAKFKLGEEEVEFNKLKSQLLEKASSLQTKFKREAFSEQQEANTKNFIKRTMFGANDARKKYLSELSQMPWVTRWLDGHEEVGIFYQSIVQPMVEGLKRVNDLHKEVSKPVSEVIRSIPKKQRAKYSTIYHIPELKGVNGHSGNLHGMNILSIMLNMGNESNLTKLLLGEGWATEGDKAAISTNNEILQAILRKFKVEKNDWDMVQSIWDNTNKLYNPMVDAYKKESGLPAPEKIKALSIETPFGKYAGGFYPIKYDAKRSMTDKQRQERDAAMVESAFSMTGSLRPSVVAGTVNERTGYHAPIDLNLRVLDRHIKETIHYIGMAEPVRNVNKIISDGEISKLLEEKLGEKEFSKFKPWLLKIAKQGHKQPDSFDNRNAFSDFLGTLRRGMTMTYMGFRATSGALQVAGLTNSAKELGSLNTLQGMKDTWFNGNRHIFDNMRHAYHDAIDKGSNVIPARLETFDREIAEAESLLAGKSDFKATMQRLSMRHIGLIQLYTVDLPTWHGAYHAEIERSGDVSKAISYADFTVENLQGSSNVYAQSEWQSTDNEFRRTFYAFATFANSQINQQRNFIRQIQDKKLTTLDIVAGATFLYMIPPLIEGAIKGMFDNEDDEEIRKELAWRMIDNATMGLPVVRDTVSLAKGFSGLSTPALSLVGRGIESGVDIAQGDGNIKDVKNVSLFLATMANIPGGSQAWVTGESLYKWAEEGEISAYELLLTGPEK